MKPPALADWLFIKLAPQHIRRDVLGDLHEEFARRNLVGSIPMRARLWYWHQVIGTLLQYRIALGTHKSPRGFGAPSSASPTPREIETMPIGSGQYDTALFLPSAARFLLS